MQKNKTLWIIKRRKAADPQCFCFESMVDFYFIVSSKKNFFCRWHTTIFSTVLKGVPGIPVHLRALANIHPRAVGDFLQARR